MTPKAARDFHRRTTETECVYCGNHNYGSYRKFRNHIMRMHPDTIRADFVRDDDVLLEQEKNAQ